jgi:zinc protease
LPEYLNQSLYGKRLPIGDDELIKTFKHDVIKRFHRDWYRPNLQAVMVVGDIEPAEAERLIKQNLKGLKIRPIRDLVLLPLIYLPELKARPWY